MRPIERARIHGPQELQKSADLTLWIGWAMRPLAAEPARGVQQLTGGWGWQEWGDRYFRGEVVEPRDRPGGDCIEAAAGRHVCVCVCVRARARVCEREREREREKEREFVCVGEKERQSVKERERGRCPFAGVCECVCA